MQQSILWCSAVVALILVFVPLPASVIVGTLIAASLILLFVIAYTLNDGTFRSESQY
jgi:hypothetical protein